MINDTMIFTKRDIKVVKYINIGSLEKTPSHSMQSCKKAHQCKDLFHFTSLSCCVSKAHTKQYSKTNNFPFKNGKVPPAKWKQIDS